MQTLGPAEAGDDGPRIQAAIDALAALPLDERGFRGALLLTRGLYRIATSIVVNASGIVLRGEGQGADGTVLLATGATQRSLVQLRGSGGLAEVPGSRRPITDDHVPVGARSFQVDDASGFAVGDTVVVHRPTTQAWVDHVGMDSCLTVDTPYDTARQQRQHLPGQPLGGGVQGSALRPDRHRRRGQPDHRRRAHRQRPGEGVRGRHRLQIQRPPGASPRWRWRTCAGDSEFVAPDDELHGWSFVEIRTATNAWVRDITAMHYGYAAVTVVGNSKWVTVQDSTSLEPVSQITGGRRYTWNVDDSQMVLFQRNSATTGRHDFVQGSNVPGPNVFLAGTAMDARDDIGPHHRWSAGGLYDGIVSNRSIRIRNRGNSGTGHGWAGASIVVWNSKAPTILVQNPPGAQNWAIGCESAQMGNGDLGRRGHPRDAEEPVPAAAARIAPGPRGGAGHRRAWDSPACWPGSHLALILARARTLPYGNHPDRRWIVSMIRTLRDEARTLIALIATSPLLPAGLACAPASTRGGGTDGPGSARAAAAATPPAPHRRRLLRGGQHGGLPASEERAVFAGHRQADVLLQRPRPAHRQQRPRPTGSPCPRPPKAGHFGFKVPSAGEWVIFTSRSVAVKVFTWDGIPLEPKGVAGSVPECTEVKRPRVLRPDHRHETPRHPLRRRLRTTVDVVISPPRP